MKPKKQSWIVRMRATIEKEVITSDCTEDQARNDPFMYAQSETELSQDDYKVLSVEPND
jgi:hypothetical protein